jgi:hypothetical protein
MIVTSYYRPIEDWNVQFITDMSYIFSDLRTFCNPYIGSWNVSSVKDFVSELNPGNWVVLNRFPKLYHKSCTPLQEEEHQ